MSLPKINPTTTKAWQDLLEHFSRIQNVKMTDLFAKDANRANMFLIEWEDFYIDFSKNRITEETLALLLKLAEQVNLKEAIASQFSGNIINETENRAVLHAALRAPETETILVNGENIIPEIAQVKRNIKTFTNQVLTGKLMGFTGKAFTDVVNIGIGGSDLGPNMVVESLKYYKNHINTHFVSNVDGDHIHEVIKKINPETTLFIIVSKTFTTQETLSNAYTIKKWFLSHASEEAVSKHFVAVSAHGKIAEKFGILPDRVFPMWDWVGGRFSLWSAVGLSISLSIGYDNFEKLLKGAHKMDIHFKTADFDKNIPVILALISVWYNNFFEAESEAVIPYTQYFDRFTTYLQQAVMESNGKSTDRNGEPVNYQTGSIIWGRPGTNAQHAFFQLLHQGTKLIPADFIGFGESLHGNQDHQDNLISNFIAQTEALLNGKSKKEVIEELKLKGKTVEEIKTVLPFKVFEGNKPTNTIFIKKLTPESLGKLIALYEHKIFIQGVIWNIFSYDQFGVELGKELSQNILQDIKNNTFSNYDPSTANILKFYLKK
ncbi:glucose-6-phosphate isomerase [Bizionia argentinensis JUB59]|uniref:Glucose-6-phosphate isomerase n=1 Tax=Bizionia argentinensis JUB59 TaxID=1046627 RepID=G2EH63_9FLAO|nr:glucose-6-phosphate isomerase [Bizionia argentinensis]EGV42254.1 glucose-6-phosphate isomerase [Bizionia argentinensis JUB59]